MAQPSVAREPSMEEILASIRRIIESNEPDAAKAAGAVQSAYDYDEPEADPRHEAPEVEDEEIHLTIEDQLPVFTPAVPERAAAPQPQAQPQMRAPAPAPQAEMTAAPARREAEPRSISLADVAARVRAASERVPSEPQASVAAEPVASQSRTVELRQAPQPQRPVSEPAQRPGSAQPFSAQPFAGQAEMEMRPSRPITEPAPQMQAAAPTAPRSAEAELASLAANDRAGQEVSARSMELRQPFADLEGLDHEQLRTGNEEAKALVSAETGKQVARSFGELAEMVETTTRRSLDEVAEDLLRPMLQDWLDDNLPTLVERLVREEIERVARGPRR